MFFESRTEKPVNEDALGISSSVWLIADGASALKGGNRMQTGSDAAWLARSIARSAKRFENLDASIESILKIILNELSAAFGECPEDEMPSCTVSIVRASKRTQAFEYFILGDSPLLFALKDRPLRLVDERVAFFDDKVLEAMARIRQNDDLSLKALRALPEIQSMLIANRAHKNNPEGGYPIVDLNASWFAPLTGSIPFDEVNGFALYSDGFDQLQGFLHESDDDFVIRLQNDPAGAMDLLWSLQEEDPDARALLRLKKRDDTSLMAVDAKEALKNLQSDLAK